MAEPVADEADDNAANAATDDDDRPEDESYLVGATGVEEQVLAEAARAEGELQSGEESDDEGAVT